MLTIILGEECGRSKPLPYGVDVKYIESITLLGDIKILFATVRAVLKREGISSETSATMEEFFGSEVKK